MGLSTKMSVVCIYHKGCLDGIGAAWSVWKSFKNMGTEITLIPAAYGDTVPEGLAGKLVYIVDFSYKREQIIELAKIAKIIVLDHHTTAKKELAGIFPVDESRSGAMLSWNYFNGDLQPPLGVEYVQDRDLWQFKLEGTREWTSAAFSYPMTVEQFDELISRDPKEVCLEGKGILRKQGQDVLNIAAATRTMRINGYFVPVVNANYMFASDLGTVLSKDQGFSVTYVDSKDKRTYSLRSDKYGMDVSVIAESFGGGGHVHAAGFSISFNDPRFAKSHIKLDKKTLFQKLLSYFNKAIGRKV